MKRIILQSIIIAAVIFNILFIFVGPACAELCDMGGMSVEGYSHYIGMLGIICGLLFCLGINQ